MFICFKRPSPPCLDIPPFGFTSRQTTRAPKIARKYTQKFLNFSTLQLYIKHLRRFRAKNNIKITLQVLFHSVTQRKAQPTTRHKQVLATTHRHTQKQDTTTPNDATLLLYAPFIIRNFSFRDYLSTQSQHSFSARPPHSFSTQSLHYFSTQSPHSFSTRPLHYFSAQSPHPLFRDNLRPPSRALLI